MSEKYNLPESFERKFENFHLPKHLSNIGIMNDVHIPYYSKKAVSDAFDYFIQKNVDAIFLNGDIVDAYPLSKFQPDPRQRKWWEEIEAFKQFIRAIKENITPNIYYKKGNHEERYENMMIVKCPEFLGVAQFEFENIMGCHDLGVEVIGDQRIVYIGKLPCVHGHEVKMKYASVNPARTLFLKTYKSSICGHLHRTSNHTEQSLDGKAISTFSVGHLGESHPKYFPINTWNHGIARVETNEDGDFEVINFNLNKSKLYRL